MDEPRPEVWRVYLPEWLTFYQSRQYGETGWEECYAWLCDHYKGKVWEPDIRIVTPEGQSLSATSGYSGFWRLQLRLPNLKGEYKDRTAADSRASELGEDATVVARHSPAERKLTDYGKRRIHAAR